MGAQLEEGFVVPIGDDFIKAMFIGIGCDVKGFGAGYGFGGKLAEGVVKEIKKGVGMNLTVPIAPIIDLDQNGVRAFSGDFLEGDFEEVFGMPLGFVDHVME